MEKLNWLRKGLLYMTLAATVQVEGAQNTPSKLHSVLRKPLILGASVSGDHSAQSPGKRLAMQYTSKNNIKTIAKNGAGSFKILEAFKESDVKDRSIIIALDLFFWDSTLNSFGSSVHQLNKITEAAETYGVPIVIGEIPDLIPGWQPQRERLNKEIRAKCNAIKNCYSISLEDILKQLMTQGFVESDGRKYTLAELLPDGLHLSSAGSSVVALRLKKLLEEKI